MLTGETPSPLSLFGRRGEKEGYHGVRQLAGIRNNILNIVLNAFFKKKPLIIFTAEVMEVELLKLFKYE